MDSEKLPIVDENKIRSQTSEIEFEKIFSMKNGFNSQRVQPDYGDDYSVEIIKNSNVTNYKFNVQLKSTKKIKFIKENNFISHEIKVSTINYLNKFPQIALIIIYDIKNKKFYYDYIWNILPRLSKQHGNENWKSRKNVSVNIPTNNIITDITINDIHEKIFNMFEYKDNILMQHQNIDYYKDNHSIDSKKYKVNIDDIDSIVDFMENEGINHLNTRHIKYLNELVEKLPIKIVINNETICYISSIVKIFLGEYVTAKIFIDECYKKIDKYDNDKKELIEYYEFKLKFMYNELNYKNYYSKLLYFSKQFKYSKIKPRIMTEKMTLELLLEKPDQFQLKINIEKLLSAIEQLNAVKEGKIDELYLSVDMISLLFTELSIYYQREIGKIAMLDKIGIEIDTIQPLEQRRDTAVFISNILEKSIKLINGIINYSKSKKDNILWSICTYEYVHFSYMFEMSTRIFSNTADDIENTKKQFNEKTGKLIIAYKIFKNHLITNDAYRSACLLNDIKEFFIYFYKEELKIEVDCDLKKEIDHYEKENSLTPYKSLLSSYKEINGILDKR